MAKALEGIKILDLSQFEAGPSCTEQLAFLGADVVKIEPTGGEVGRTFLKTKEDKTGFDSWYFLSLNANKRGITLNLKSPKGIAMFKDMVKKADVVVAISDPGHGKDGAWLRCSLKDQPEARLCGKWGFGQGGPYSNYLSMDACAKAIGGSFSNTGLLETPPRNPGPTIGDTGLGCTWESESWPLIFMHRRPAKGSMSNSPWPMRSSISTASPRPFTLSTAESPTPDGIHRML